MHLQQAAGCVHSAARRTQRDAVKSAKAVAPRTKQQAWSATARPQGLRLGLQRIALVVGLGLQYPAPLSSRPRGGDQPPASTWAPAHRLHVGDAQTESSTRTENGRQRTEYTQRRVRIHLLPACRPTLQLGLKTDTKQACGRRCECTNTDTTPTFVDGEEECREPARDTPSFLYGYNPPVQNFRSRRQAAALSCWRGFAADRRRSAPSALPSSPGAAVRQEAEGAAATRSTPAWRRDASRGDAGGVVAMPGRRRSRWRSRGWWGEVWSASDSAAEPNLCV